MKNVLCESQRRQSILCCVHKRWGFPSLLVFSSLGHALLFGFVFFSDSRRLCLQTDTHTHTDIAPPICNGGHKTLGCPWHTPQHCFVWEELWAEPLHQQQGCELVVPELLFKSETWLGFPILLHLICVVLFKVTGLLPDLFY